MSEKTDARRERSALCDLLSDLGPDQPTLCAGWATRDLAAHLILRERRPDASLGIAVRRLAGHTARVQRSLAARPYPELVATLRRPPRWLVTPLDRMINTMEFFVHHEDVRRARPEWQPRPLPADLGEQLWRRVSYLARPALRRFRAAVVVEAPGYGEVRCGKGGDEVRLRGDPGELVIFLMGRQRVARVDLAGPPELTGRLARARLGG